MAQRNKNVGVSHAPLRIARLRAMHRMSVAASSKRVLLALCDDGCAAATLWRARSLALLLNAELHVVRVVPPLPRTQRVFSRPEPGDVLGALKRMLEARRATRSWLTTTLGQELPKGRLKLRSGEFFDQVVKRTEELGAALIVVPPSEQRAGARVTRLARAAGAPVLVAREAMSREAVVAATDLREGTDAVLRSAAALCELMNAPMVALHNLTPIAVPAGPDAALQVTLPVHHGLEQLRRRSLAESAQRLRSASEAVLTKSLDAAEAILKEARARDADLIVVGTRRRSWLDWPAKASVSARVINQARRSVLVTPLGCGPRASRKAV